MDATTMTTEASNTQLTKSRRGPPAYRKPNQTRAGRLRKEMIADFVTKLGGAGRISTIQMQDVERYVDLDLLAREARAGVRQGKVKILDLTSLEGAADRALRRLNLPAPGAASRPVPSVTEYWASRHEEEG
jgi:hypothetical protein